MNTSDFSDHSTYEVVDQELDGSLSVKTVNINKSPYLNIDLDSHYGHIQSNMDDEYSDEDFTKQAYWDTLDRHLKEFACPRHKKVEPEREFKNESNVVPFPRDMDKHGVQYLVPNSPLNIRNSKLIWGYYRDPKRHVAKLTLEEKFSRMNLRNLINMGMLHDVDKVISIGNQSILLHANCNTSYPKLKLPTECVIKLFKTKLKESIVEKEYEHPDFRYNELFCKDTRRVVKQWAKDEFNILTEMENFGINCPKPILLKSNFIIMSHIGDKDIPAPSLATLKLEQKKWDHIYAKVLQVIENLYEGGLVHGDLSEHNILWWDNKCWIIDVSQAVHTDHPKAFKYLWRDCKAITRFFEQKLPYKIIGPQNLFTLISSK